MTKFNFLSLWVVIQQHTPLDVVQVNLENNTNNKHFFFSLDMGRTCKILNDSKIQKSESVYFLQILRDKLRRLYCHHDNKAKNPEPLKVKTVSW